MNYKIGDIIYGFRLTKEERIDDIDSNGYLFVHEKSGARLMYIENSDDNKVFFIAFKTPPENDCGIAHIIEHSVLCGSEKYPVKDPFNELAKGSLNTYLNALTYSDKTVYPIASRNNRDFMNLMDVYMDAVFNPLILKHKEIFMQEGHHLHMEAMDSELEVRGVVYNEMKGAFSDPDRYIEGAVNTALFTDSPYKYESGGDPDKIPQLTYEEFTDFYKKNYHPSNSYIFLFGKMDIEERLAYLDRDYLSKYSVEVFANTIKHEKGRGIVRKEESYPVVEKKDNEAIYAAGFVTGSSCDEQRCLGYSILSYILMDTNASPVRTALMKNGFCSDTEGWYDSSMYDTVFTIIAKGAKENSAGEFEGIVSNELEKLIEQGIDRELVISAVNTFDFMLSEEDFGYKPRGLYYGLKSMNTWLHEDNPFDAFRFKKHIKSIRSKIDEGYFEGLISDIISNPSKAFVSLQPEEGLQEKLDREKKKQMSEYKNSLSDAEKQKIVDDTANLLKFQSKEDDLSVMPVLKLSDIDKKADLIENEERDGVLFVPQNTNDIVYSELAFNVDDIPQKDYCLLGLLSDLVGKLDTEKYSYNELPKKIDMYTGGVSAQCSAYYNTSGKTEKVLTVSGKALSVNTERLIDIIEQCTVKMSFYNTESLKLIIRDRISKLENYLTQNGHMTASARALSYFNESYGFKEATGGIGYFKFLCELDKGFDGSVCEKLKELAMTVFSRDRLLTGISCEDKDFNGICKIRDVFGINKITGNITDYKTESISEGVATAGRIQYVAKAAPYGNYKYSGKMLVLKNILNLEYLWNTVRVQGGAYGCGFNIIRSGAMYMYSYRDPNLKRTLDVYDNAADFISSFDADEKAMTNYIIGAINSIDRPTSKEQRLKISVVRKIVHLTDEMKQRERDELLSATAQDMREYAKMLEAMKKSPYTCVIGNKDNIQKEKGLFKNIINMK